MTGESLNIQQDQLEKLKQLFPETITEGKIDWEKLQATLGKENIEFLNERYVLNWAGKADAFKVLQIPTTATLKPQPDQSINFDTTQNVFIEGENLEVLKVLQKAYYGKVKVVCIDPPYNTGNDSFIYPDSFKENKADYEKRIGDKDEEGYLMKEGMFRKNSKDSGHYHSNWLSMMYPRLFLAKNLLRDDGVIFVHIDDNEVHNLRMVMNEIFGDENFVGCLKWKKKKQPSFLHGHIASIMEYILIFGKHTDQLEKLSIEKRTDANTRIDNASNKLSERIIKKGIRVKLPSDISIIKAGVYKNKTMETEYLDDVIIKNGRTQNDFSIKAQFRNEQNGIDKFIEEDVIFITKNYGLRRDLLNEELDRRKSITDLLLDWGDNQDSDKEMNELFPEGKPFEYPKPSKLISNLISSINSEHEIIIDFFGGSGTTSQAVLELNKEDGGNRKFILVQLPELCNEESEAFKTGYKTIADIGKERIRRVIKKIEKEKAEKTEENQKLAIAIEEHKAELAKLKKAKPELNFEDANQSKEVKKILDNIEKLEKKIEQNDEFISKINNCDLGCKVFKLSPSNFKIWRGNEITEENLVTQLDAFTNPVREESKTDNMLYELMLKAGFALTDKVETKGKFYSVNDGELIIALEEINQKIIDGIITAQPKKVITLDNLFTGNDQLKTNTVLQMKDAGIDFKTI